MIIFFSYVITCSNLSSITDVIGKKTLILKLLSIVSKFESFIVVSRVENNLISAHINHVRDVAGVESVGIGASYDGINA